MPIAERWLPKPESLESGAGMHRFVWDLRWEGSGESEALEDDEYGPPRGPRAAPGTYQVKLSVDGMTMSEPLQITMDPRSKATAEELAEQQRLGLEIYGEVLLQPKGLGEVKAAQASLKKLAGELKDEGEAESASRKSVSGDGRDSEGKRSGDWGWRLPRAACSRYCGW